MKTTISIVLILLGLLSFAFAQNSTSNSSDSFEFPLKINISAKNLTSKLNSEQQEELSIIFEWKNSATRRDINQDEVPPIFAPEQSYYNQSIQLLGIWCFLGGATILLLLILYLLFAECFGCCKKQKKQKLSEQQNQEGQENENETKEIKVSNFQKASSQSCMGMGIILYFVTTILAIIYTVDYNNQVSSAENSLSRVSNNIQTYASDYQQYILNIKNQSLINPLTNSSFGWDIYDYQNVIDDVQQQSNGILRLQNYIRNDRKSLIVWTWFFFSFGFVVSIIMIVARKFQLGFAIKFAGIIMIISSGICLLGSGIWYYTSFKAGDICEQNTKVINNEFIDQGKGINYFFTCLGQQSQINLRQANYLNTIKIEEAANVTIYYLNQLNMTNLSSNLNSTNNFTDLSIFDKGDQNVKLWSNVVSNIVKQAQNLLYLSQCSYKLDYSVDSQASYCVPGVTDNYLVFIWLLLKALAFLMMGVGGISMEDYLIKLKIDKSNSYSVQQQFSNYN